MMNKKRVLIPLLFMSFIVVSCGKKPSSTTPTSGTTPTSSVHPTSTTPSSQDTNKHTVIWKNYDGSILKIDNEVLEGTVPTYEGTPSRESSAHQTYTFKGWSPEVVALTSDVTYKAVFEKTTTGDLVAGLEPVKSVDDKSISYGYYPQTRVSDSALIGTLNTLTKDSVTGWYLHNGEYYTKEVAKVYNNSSYTFDDGEEIVNGTTYWFKCEPIEWKILSSNGDSYKVVSDKLLDAHNFYQDYMNRGDIYPNNYSQSSIRTWLNDDFYKTAFALYKGGVGLTYVDDSTSDRVALLTYQDCLDAHYGFNGTNTKDDSRVARTTDYARARGAWYYTDKTTSYNGSYWTMSAADSFSYCAWNVNSGGYLSVYPIDGDSHCVRPSIEIVL